MGHLVRPTFQPERLRRSESCRSFGRHGEHLSCHRRTFADAPSRRLKFFSHLAIRYNLRHFQEGSTAPWAQSDSDACHSAHGGIKGIMSSRSVLSQPTLGAKAWQMQKPWNGIESPGINPRTGEFRTGEGLKPIRMFPKSWVYPISSSILEWDFP